MDEFFTHLFKISDPLYKPPFRGWVHLGGDRRRQLLRGEVQQEEPVVVTHAMGGKPTDFIWTTSVGSMIVHRRVLDIMENEDFTGWRPYAVQVIGKDGEEIPGYSGISITGRCGALDPDLSEIFMKRFPAREAPMYRGLYFHRETWDGSDFFCPITPGCTYKFITERVQQAFKKAKLRNVMMQRLDEIETSPSSL